MQTTVTFPNGVVMTFGETTIAPTIAPKNPAAPARTKAEPIVKAAPVKAVAKPVTKPRTNRAKKARGSDKPIYAEIRRLTENREYDAAYAIAKAENWPHVVDSIDRHRAKHGTVKPEPTVEVKPVTKKAAPARAKASPVTTKKVAPAKVAPVKATPAPKATRTRTKTAAAATATRAMTAKATAKVSNKPVEARTKDVDALPDHMSEADLVLHWADLALAGHYDVLRACHDVTKRQFVQAAGAGDRANATIFDKRSKALRNLIKAA